MTALLASTDPVLDDFAERVGTDDPVAVAGSRTRWTTGGELVEGTRVIEAPTGIVDYRPEEMTVAVRAGTTVAELDAALAERGQRSAVPDRGGTVGGALVVGENDVRALGRGLVRTAPLQVRYVSAEGRIITSGGPTVKNVSGYDLPRLMVGSLGTLGLLAEVILRTNPTPELSQWYVATEVDPRRVFDTVLAPSCVLWDGTTTWVELEGHAADVRREARALRARAAFAETDGPPQLPPHRWSLPPTPPSSPNFEGLATSDVAEPSNFVEVVGFGLRFADEPQPLRPLEPPVAELHRRIKQNFDPTGRLNPGRDAARR